ncbi:unnamed protein product [Dictyota dichotoma]
MALPKITEIEDLNVLDLDNEILTLKKQLFKLRFCKATKETFKPHEFTHKKRRLAQLLFKKQILENKEQNLTYL